MSPSMAVTVPANAISALARISARRDRALGRNGRGRLQGDDDRLGRPAGRRWPAATVPSSLHASRRRRSPRRRSRRRPRRRPARRGDLGGADRSAAARSVGAGVDVVAHGVLQQSGQPGGSAGVRERAGRRGQQRPQLGSLVEARARRSSTPLPSSAPSCPARRRVFQSAELLEVSLNLSARPVQPDARRVRRHVEHRRDLGRAAAAPRPTAAAARPRRAASLRGPWPRGRRGSGSSGATSPGGSTVVIRRPAGAAGGRCARRWPGSCGRRRTPTAAPASRGDLVEPPPAARAACRRARRRRCPGRYGGPGTGAPARPPRPPRPRSARGARRRPRRRPRVQYPGHASRSTPGPADATAEDRGNGRPGRSSAPAGPIRRFSGWSDLRSPCRPCRRRRRASREPSRACPRRRPRW